MKSEIEKTLPEHILKKSNAKEIFIVDRKNNEKTLVSLLEKEPADIKYVFLKNQEEIPVWFDGFKDNALPTGQIGTYSKQCECIIFPENDGYRDWVLFIEMKYVNNLKNAFRKEYEYPYCMVNQILETVNYFRAKGILENDRRATAIVSFPNLIEEFNGFFFDFIDDTPENILNKHKVLIYPTNSATIMHNKRIKPQQPHSHGPNR